MDCISTRLPYRQTGYFSKVILDYIDQAAALKPFFSQSPSLQGIAKAIEEKKKSAVDRNTLVNELKAQYKNVTTSPAVTKNIEALLSENTFTITTAHQPNLFTGPLYFIYKVLHTVKLAEHCKTSLSGYSFVPVFYMGSEDADLDELGHFYFNGDKIVWNTKQTGAVGRMKVDKELIKLIELISGQLSVLPFGNEMLDIIRDCYREGVMVQDAMFKLLNMLFGDYGLVVLIADRPALKRQMIKVFEDDLLHQGPSSVIEKTVDRLQEAGYKIQANPREVNLFYLEEGIRNRIVKEGTRYKVQDTNLNFSEEEILKELNDHPEKFSPNVILRGLYQETILPNLVCIGGGGETAYWLQLKGLFEQYKVPYPVLVLRDSFLIVEKKWQEKVSKLGFTVEDFFLPEQEILNRFVLRENGKQVQLNGQLDKARALYEELKTQAGNIDITLAQHVEALRTRSLHHLQELEKKMLRAEKRKFTEQQRQIQNIKHHLFPKNGLQERIDNFMLHYAGSGKQFFEMIYQHSLTLEQEFVVLLLN